MDDGQQMRTLNEAANVAADNPWAKLATRYVMPITLLLLSLFAHSWFNQLDQTMGRYGAAIDKLSAVNDATHKQLREFRDETAAARVVTARRLEVIEEETSRKLEAIREENRTLSNQIKDIEPRVKEIETQVKGKL